MALIQSVVLKMPKGYLKIVEALLGITAYVLLRVYLIFKESIDMLYISIVSASFVIIAIGILLGYLIDGVPIQYRLQDIIFLGLGAVSNGITGVCCLDYLIRYGDDFTDSSAWVFCGLVSLTGIIYAVDVICLLGSRRWE